MVDRIRTGVPGLDHILDGGLLPTNLYLVKGAPGSGKTTLGLQFLVEGAGNGEKCLYLGLSETRGQLATIAHSFGWSLQGIEIHEMRRRGEAGREREGYTVFSPSEVEMQEISREVLEQIERVQPARVVLDSLSEIRLLAEGPLQYRRELLALIDRIGGRKTTGIFIDVETEDSGAVAETLVSGVIELEQVTPVYGGERRRLRVRKFRASRSVGGYHDLAIVESGLQCYPRLVAATHRSEHSSAEVSSAIGQLDALLGGGLDRGTSTLLMGPAGTGKSTVVLQFVVAAAARGEPGTIFCFDESPTNLLVRAAGLGIPADKHVQSGLIRLVPVDPAELSPGELAHLAQVEVARGVRLLSIDSINGYMNAMPDEHFLSAHLHELLAYLSEKGVATLLTLAQLGMLGTAESTVNISYIADTVIVLRYFEAAGSVRQAISVLKKRTGRHERTIRELTFSSRGIAVGEPLSRFQGVLTGLPALTKVGSPGGDLGS